MPRCRDGAFQAVNEHAFGAALYDIVTDIKPTANYAIVNALRSGHDNPSESIYDAAVPFHDADAAITSEVQYSTVYHGDNDPTTYFAPAEIKKTLTNEEAIAMFSGESFEALSKAWLQIDWNRSRTVEHLTSVGQMGTFVVRGLSQGNGLGMSILKSEDKIVQLNTTSSREVCICSYSCGSTRVRPLFQKRSPLHTLCRVRRCTCLLISTAQRQAQWRKLFVTG